MFRSIFFAVALGILAAWFIINATKDDRRILWHIVSKIFIIAGIILIIWLIRLGLERLDSVSINIPERVGGILSLSIILIFPLFGWLSNVKAKGGLKKRWADRKESRKKMTEEEKKKHRKGDFLGCLKYIGIILGGVIVVVGLVILIIYLVAKL